MPSSFTHRQYRPDPLHVYNKVDLGFPFFVSTIAVMAIRLFKTKRKFRLTKQYYKFPLGYRKESHIPGSSRSDMQLPLLHWEAWKWQWKSLVTCMFWTEQQTPVASPPEFPVSNVGSRSAALCFAAGCWRQLKQQLAVGSPDAIPLPSRALHKARGRLDSPEDLPEAVVYPKMSCLLCRKSCSKPSDGENSSLRNERTSEHLS